jgi:2'-5' RNA ligase
MLTLSTTVNTDIYGAVLPPLDGRPDPQKQQWANIAAAVLRRDFPGQSMDDRYAQVDRYRGAVYIAVKAIMNGMSGASCKLLKRSKRPTSKGLQLKSLQANPESWSDEWEPLPFEHAACQLFRHVNSQQTFDAFLAEYVMMWELTGRVFVWTVPGERYGKPCEMWIVRTPFIQPIYSAATTEYPFGAWQVTLPMPMTFALPNVGNIIIDNREIVQHRQPHPRWWWDGMSPVAGGGQELDSLDQINWARKNAMEKGVTLDTLVTIDGATEQSLQQLASKWTNEFTNQMKGQRVAFSSGSGASVQNLSVAPKDMSFEAGYDQLTKFALALFAVPHPIVSLVDAGSYAQLYASLMQFNVLTLLPLAKSISEHLTKHLIAPWWGDDIKLVIELPSVQSPDDKAREISRDVNILTVNQRLKMGNYSPIGEEGDVPETIFIQRMQNQLALEMEQKKAEMQQQMQQPQQGQEQQPQEQGQGQDQQAQMQQDQQGQEQQPQDQQQEGQIEQGGQPSEFQSNVLAEVLKSLGVDPNEIPKSSKGFFVSCFDSACAMVDLPSESRKLIRDLGLKIDADDLTHHGLETDPHVTLLHGIYDSEMFPGAWRKATRSVVSKTPEFELTTGQIKAFKSEHTGKDYDVLYLDIYSPNLNRLHYELKNKVPVFETYNSYVPHATIAYLKPGTAGKYIQELGQQKEIKVRCHEVVFSDCTKNKTRIPLKKSVHKMLKKSLHGDKLERFLKAGSKKPPNTTGGGSNPPAGSKTTPPTPSTGANQNPPDSKKNTPSTPPTPEVAKKTTERKTPDSATRGKGEIKTDSVSTTGKGTGTPPPIPNKPQGQSKEPLPNNGMQGKTQGEVWWTDGKNSIGKSPEVTLPESVTSLPTEKYIDWLSQPFQRAEPIPEAKRISDTPDKPASQTGQNDGTTQPPVQVNSTGDEVRAAKVLPLRIARPPATPPTKNAQNGTGNPEQPNQIRAGTPAQGQSNESSVRSQNQGQSSANQQTGKTGTQNQFNQKPNQNKPNQNLTEQSQEETGQNSIKRQQESHDLAKKIINGEEVSDEDRQYQANNSEEVESILKSHQIAQKIERGEDLTADEKQHYDIYKQEVESSNPKPQGSFIDLFRDGDTEARHNLVTEAMQGKYGQEVRQKVATALSDVDFHKERPIRKEERIMTEFEPTPDDVNEEERLKDHSGKISDKDLIHPLLEPNQTPAQPVDATQQPQNQTGQTGQSQQNISGNKIPDIDVSKTGHFATRDPRSGQWVYHEKGENWKNDVKYLRASGLEYVDVDQHAEQLQKQQASGQNQANQGRIPLIDFLKQHQGKSQEEIRKLWDEHNKEQDAKKPEFHDFATDFLKNNPNADLEDIENAYGEQYPKNVGDGPQDHGFEKTLYEGSSRTRQQHDPYDFKLSDGSQVRVYAKDETTAKNLADKYAIANRTQVSEDDIDDQLMDLPELQDETSKGVAEKAKKHLKNNVVDRFLGTATPGDISQLRSWKDWGKFITAAVVMGVARRHSLGMFSAKSLILHVLGAFAYQMISNSQGNQQPMDFKEFAEQNKDKSPEEIHAGWQQYQKQMNTPKYHEFVSDYLDENPDAGHEDILNAYREKYPAEEESSDATQVTEPKKPKYHDVSKAKTHYIANDMYRKNEALRLNYIKKLMEYKKSQIKKQDQKKQKQKSGTGTTKKNSDDNIPTAYPSKEQPKGHKLNPYGEEDLDFGDKKGDPAEKE